MDDFMMKAVSLAGESMRGGVGGPFGAVVVKDGKIVGRGVNSVTSLNDPTAHAEVMAIRDACKNLGDFQLEGCEIYTSCEPCPMCLGAIYWARLSRVFYGATKIDAADAGFDDNFIYQELERDLSEREISFQQLGRDVALQLFEDWKDLEERVDY